MLDKILIEGVIHQRSHSIPLINYLTVCGTTGEGASMTLAERKLVAEKWVEVGKDK